MPPGTPYDSFIRQYNIRVDAFASSSSTTCVPALHLLTHTHSDHVVGLSAKSFASPIICSHDAKEMLLKHEVYKERELFEMEIRGERVRTFGHLKVDPVKQSDGTIIHARCRDLLKTLPLNTPTRFDLCGNESVVITLIDANHCPGAVMFLIEGAQGAVLHTGDCRAEPSFLETITHNPFLQPYLAYPAPGPRLNVDSDNVSTRTLECIYLDTACMLSPLTIPTKEQATTGLTDLIALFPPTTFFFINSWTWGYEDVLKAVARAFRCKIHVDRYKYGIYSALSDPFLRSIITRDAASTRFHACERFARCEHVPATPMEGKTIVYINPVSIGAQHWKEYFEETSKRLGRGEPVLNLLVPLSRHSPLPELKAFVSLFRPRSIVPNTLVPALRGIDWAAMSCMFNDCLSLSSKIPIEAIDVARDATEIEQDDDMRDATLKHLEGDGAQEAAERWAESTKMTKILEFLRGYLVGHDYALVERVLNKRVSIGGRDHRETDEETDDGEVDDERGRTAHILFADLASARGKEQELGLWFHESTSPASPKTPSPQCNLVTPVSSPIRSKTHLPDKGKRKRKADGSPVSPPRTPPRKLRLKPTSPSHFSSPVRNDSEMTANGDRVSRSSRPDPFVDFQNYPLQKWMSPFCSRMLSSSDSPQAPSQSQKPLQHGTQSFRNSAKSKGVGLGLQSGHQYAHKHTLRAQRLDVAKKLSRARPDLVASSYPTKRARQLSRHIHSAVQKQHRVGVSNTASNTVSRSEEIEANSDDVVEGVNWERSRQLADEIRQAVERGQRPGLPGLVCVESQLKH